MSQGVAYIRPPAPVTQALADAPSTRDRGRGWSVLILPRSGRFVLSTSPPKHLQYRTGAMDKAVAPTPPPLPRESHTHGVDLLFVYTLFLSVVLSLEKERRQRPNTLGCAIAAACRRLDFFQAGDISPVRVYRPRGPSSSSVKGLIVRSWTVKVRRLELGG